MSRFKRLNGLIAFMAVAALLLNAAMPLLANAAAAMRGVGVGEICEVYGVRLPSQDPHAGHMMHMAHAPGQTMQMAGMDDMDDMPATQHDHDSSRPHKADHCALTGLVAFGPAGTSTSPLALSRTDFLVDLLPPHGVVFDAAARWAARLEHGPPHA